MRCHRFPVGPDADRSDTDFQLEPDTTYVYGDADRVRFETDDPAPLELTTGTPADVGATTATVTAETTRESFTT